MQRNFPLHGLLEKPDEAEMEWLRPVNAGGDPIASLITWTQDVVESNQLVFPAHKDDVAVIPPDTHVLDHLVRSEMSDDDRVEVQTQFILHPQAGTVAVVHALPECVTCLRDGHGEVVARYDARTRESSAPPRWSYFCTRCHRRYSTGRLGTGEGQYLMLLDEVSSDVLAALDVARDYWRNWRPAE